MPSVDYDGAWLDLKEHVLSKRSHGQDELLRVMNKAEVDNRIPEGQEGFDDRPAAASPPAHEEPPRLAAAR